MRPPRSLYVHIPFCRRICPYCDFPKLLASTGFQERYVPALLNEDRNYQGLTFDTIYLGGGTPSCLAPDQLTAIVETLIQRHGKPQELTIECNPEDVDDQLAQLLSSLGFNRISLGVQTVDDATLQRLGRNHTARQAEEAIARSRRAGMENISCDFIYGLPGEGENQVQNDLDWVVRMGLPHASFYSLQLEPHTAFFNAGVKEPSQDVFERDYALICARLAKAGLLRYEVSNFARPGFESRHNLCYWQGDAYAAIGYGASSYVDGVRAVRTRDMAQYLAGNYIFEEQRESLREQEFDYLMCNLRLVKGFSLEDYTARFQRDFRQAYADKIKILGDMLEFGHGRVRVCPRDLYILDSILVDLLDFESIGGKEE